MDLDWEDFPSVEAQCRNIYCETCEMWVNGPEQWQDHSIGKKHKKCSKIKKYGTPEPVPEPKSEGLVIPKGTVIIIEQIAIYNDAVRLYTLSLYERGLLRSRL